MSFLQPWVLAALPLMTLPILIHLINRRRHRSVSWAAMMFLVQAQRLNKGMARLRYVLILLMRMAAIGVLVLTLSRPLAGGWWSGIGKARTDATVILLDRSASMEAQDLQTGESKRSTGLNKLADLLVEHGHGGDLVLVDSVGGDPLLIESPKALPDLPFTAATATQADIPEMLERTLAYLAANDTGRADIWICSDLNELDWDPDSGRWVAIREQLLARPGVRLFLLAYPAPPEQNLSVRVTNAERRRRGSEADLILDVLVLAQGTGASSDESARPVPLEFEVDQVRTVVDLGLDAQGASLKGHRIPLDGETRSGWGSVTLPDDSNPLDNRFYFVYAMPPIRHAVVVTDTAGVGEAFRRALRIPADPGLRHSVEVLSSAQMGQLDWERTSLVVWQAPLPEGRAAEQLERFVDAGRVVLFFPPDEPASGQVFGARWGVWQPFRNAAARISWWRDDADLFAHVGSGDPLPWNDLRIHAMCDLDAPGTALARLEDETPLLTRVATDRGGVYFCRTLPTARYSTLERDGVGFYVLLQRALEEGSRALMVVSHRDAGAQALADSDHWALVAPESEAATVSQRGLLAGVYRDGEAWVAVNRSLDEDRTSVTAAAVETLFDGLRYERIDDAVGSTAPLVREIWRAFLLAMLLALLVESVLCLPGRNTAENPLGSPASQGREWGRDIG